MPKMPKSITINIREEIQVCGIAYYFNQGRAYINIYLVFLLMASFNLFAKDNYIEEIVLTYNANQARFHQQYRGKGIQGTGRVENVKADFLGTGSMFMIHLNVNDSSIQCITENRDSAASLNKGQEIQFRGSVHDVTFGIVSLEKCSFDNLPSQTYKNNNEPEIVSKQVTMKVKSPGELNVRSGPGVQYDVIKVIKNGDFVKSYGESNGWTKIADGWVKSGFLINQETESQSIDNLENQISSSMWSPSKNKAETTVVFPEKTIIKTKSGHSFDQYKAEIYQDEFNLPVEYYKNSKGVSEIDTIKSIIKDKNGFYWRNNGFSDITEPVAINFSGRFYLTEYGCGTQCSYDALIDLKSGKYISVEGFDPGFKVEEKEESMSYDYTDDGKKFYTTKIFQPDSIMLVEQYEFEDTKYGCRERTFVFENNKFRPISKLSYSCSNVVSR